MQTQTGYGHTHSHIAIVINVLRAAGAAQDVGVLAVEGVVGAGTGPGCQLIHQLSVLFHQAPSLLLKVFKLTTQLVLLGLGLFTVTTLWTVLFHPNHSMYSDISSSPLDHSLCAVIVQPHLYTVEHYLNLTSLCTTIFHPHCSMYSIFSPSLLYVQCYFTLTTLCTMIVHPHSEWVILILTVHPHHSMSSIILPSQL